MPISRKGLLWKTSGNLHLQAFLGLDFLLPFTAGQRRGFHSDGRQNEENANTAGPSRIKQEDKGRSRKEDKSQEFGRKIDSPRGSRHWATELRVSKERAGRDIPLDLFETTVQRSRKGKEPAARFQPRRQEGTMFASETLSHANSKPSSSKTGSYRSFTHKYIAKKDPLSAPILRQALASRPSQISSQSLIPLARLAEQTGHTTIAAEVRQVQRKIDRRYNNHGQYRPSRNEIIDDMDEPWRLRGIEPHLWARARWPLYRNLPVLNMEVLFSDLHYRIVAPSPLYPTSSPEEAVAQVERMIITEGRGRKGRIEALSELLNMYVIYAKLLGSNGLRMMRRILGLCDDLRPNRQTIHLLVQQLIWPKMLDYKEKPILQPRDEDDVDEMLKTQRQKRPRPIPSDDPDIIKHLSDLLALLHRNYHLTPGPETFRNILEFAWRRDIRPLGKFAIDGYHLAEQTPYGVVVGEGDTVRFQRVGTRFHKWRNLLRQLVHEGWIEKEEMRRILSRSKMTAQALKGDQHSVRATDGSNPKDDIPDCSSLWITSDRWGILQDVSFDSNMDDKAKWRSLLGHLQAATKASSESEFVLQRSLGRENVEMPVEEIKVAAAGGNIIA